MSDRFLGRTRGFAFAAALIVAAGPAAAAPPDLAAERGAQLAKKWCAACHAIGAGSLAADTGPTFQDIARRRSPDYIRGFLANPHDRGQMPAFDVSPEQIEDIIQHLQSLK